MFTHQSRQPSCQCIISIGCLANVYFYLSSTFVFVVVVSFASVDVVNDMNQFKKSKRILQKEKPKWLSTN